MARKFRARNTPVTPAYLDLRIKDLADRGYGKTKWIGFCEDALDLGLSLRLYEAKHTVSKYITVSNDRGKEFKVRFSNHRPIKAREEANDCDFFVGVSNKNVTTTVQALQAVKSHFELEEAV
ncbi:hypothetical protein RI570_21330 [Brucella pseudogrignonensis]|uniref:hypothetical protein n=1 Tax=Brucella pseudogrignonensis TaxID=419475 RepID=UPI0028B731CB|nr:hypothetical protein [Brucella pseudogrignonensis]MDT6940782.1 hypothetical protein [Brucella pseudogrignonensis]MDT6942595.1 hypothetical protein [Brucella pseudogrignonensis]